MRLIGLNKSNHGRLELYRNGNWQSICNDKWTVNETRVLCRQLGYDDFRKVDHHEILGKRVNVWKNDTKCSSSEKALSECSSKIRSSKECKGVVQVKCIGKGKIVK